MREACVKLALVRKDRGFGLSAGIASAKAEGKPGMFPRYHCVFPKLPSRGPTISVFGNDDVMQQSPRWAIPDGCWRQGRLHLGVHS